MNKIVLLTYDFAPSAASVGAFQRMAYLAAFLRAKEIDVQVLAADGKEIGWFGFRELIEPMRVIRFTSFVNRMRGARSQIALSERSARNELLGWLGRSARWLSSFAFPDYSIFDFLHVARQLRRSVLAPQTTLLISAPPHGLLLHAFWVKALVPHVKIALDYRDGWNSQEIFRPRFRLSQYVGRRLERAVLRRASLVVFASPQFPKLLKEALGVDVGGKGLLVMNGWANVPGSGKAKARLKVGALNIGYFGAADERTGSYRNIGPLLEAVGQADFPLMLHCFGPVELKRSTSEYPNVTFYGSVSQGDALETMSQLDLLVVLHTDPRSAAEPIPAKLFDYIKAGRPILCVWAGEGAAPFLVTQYELGLVVDSRNVQGIRDALMKCGSLAAGFCRNDAVVAEFSRDAQYARLLSRIHNMGR